MQQTEMPNEKDASLSYVVISIEASTDKQVLWLLGQRVGELGMQVQGSSRLGRWGYSRSGRGDDDDDDDWCLTARQHYVGYVVPSLFNITHW